MSQKKKDEENRSMPKLEIVDTEFLGDKNHFLYWLTPKCVAIKIQSYLDREEIPIIDRDFEEQLQELLGKADEMLYISPYNYQNSLKIFNSLTTAIAILAFCPGGLDIFGRKYSIG